MSQLKTDDAVEKTAAAPPGSRVKKTILLSLKIAVTVGLFVLIASKIDLGDLWQRLASAQYSLLLLGTGFVFLQLGFNAARWRSLLWLEGVSMPLLQSFRFYLEAMFFNQALPGAIGGDVLRVYRAKAYCTGLGQAFNSVVLDRLTGLIGLAILILVGLPLLVARSGQASLWQAFLVIAVVSCIGIAALLLLARLPTVGWPQKGFGAKARALLIDLAKQFDRLVRRPRVAGPILILALATHAVGVVGAFVAVKALHLDVSLIECLIVVPSAVFLAMMPISLGGWGVREGAMAAGFALVGAAPEAGVAVSVVLGLQILVVGLIGGAVWFLGGASLPAKRGE